MLSGGWGLNNQVSHLLVEFVSIKIVGNSFLIFCTFPENDLQFACCLKMHLKVKIPWKVDDIKVYLKGPFT